MCIIIIKQNLTQFHIIYTKYMLWKKWYMDEHPGKNTHNNNTKFIIKFEVKINDKKITMYEFKEEINVKPIEAALLIFVIDGTAIWWN